MSVVLHIGLPKTGTTYLQEWLKLNNDKLRQSGVAVLSSAAAHRLAAASLTDSSLSSRADVLAIERDCTLPQAAKEMHDYVGHVRVVSSEYFFHCDPSDVRVTMDALGVSVSSIICYVRRQDRVCASGYAQEVKALGLAKRIADYGEVSYNPLLDWNQLYEKWETAFPSAAIIFENFESCVANGTLVKTFRASIGATEVETFNLPERVNQSLSAHLTEFARILNEKRSAYDLDRLMDIQGRTKLPPFAFDQATTQLFERIYLPTNQLLAKRFPLKFEEYCTSGWRPNGIDMTDRLDAEQQADILFRYVSRD
ncbi:hypothetical protein [Rhizobium leguminosarum]|uniref:hypothetical protein n=1 Tax=Rhizobium leguminosarum TaxID=384 RepID=UPI00144168F5|nr:hypothetical protein [Rhizobium leguminosarum]NKL63359.1 hypothetical protein [Rhizobium leguminosarum bv. viciae]